MEKISVDCGGAVLQCEVLVTDDDKKKNLLILQAENARNFLHIPDKYEKDNIEYIFTGIDKKAFLGNRNLLQVSLPGSIKEIRDWAFSQCTHLDKVVIRGGLIDDICSVTFGRSVFEGCEKLNDICLGYEESDDTSVLLAVAAHRLKSDHLLHESGIGSPNWYGLVDRQLLSFLNTDDDAAYDDLALCGEEDIMYSRQEYCSNNRKIKSVLCFDRLMNDRYCTDDVKKVITSYLLEHTCGTLEDEAWQVLTEKYNDRLEYVTKFCEIGAVTKDNIDIMLKDIGESYAQLKAYLIDYKQKIIGQNIFDDFIL